jgi:hypothetical protein
MVLPEMLRNIGIRSPGDGDRIDTMKLSSFPVRIVVSANAERMRAILFNVCGGFNGKPAGANAQRIQRVELHAGAVFGVGFVVAATVALPGLL